jgi:hypothetical protein
MLLMMQQKQRPKKVNMPAKPIAKQMNTNIELNYFPHRNTSRYFIQAIFI